MKELVDAVAPLADLDQVSPFPGAWEFGYFVNGDKLHETLMSAYGAARQVLGMEEPK